MASDERVSAWSPHFRVNDSFPELSIGAQANKHAAGRLGFEVGGIPDHQLDVALTVAWSEEGYDVLVTDRGENGWRGPTDPNLCTISPAVAGVVETVRRARLRRPTARRSKGSRLKRPCSNG